MIEGFDKEIDAILRKSREDDFAFTNNVQNHLDADEISAFAENALPEKTKNLYTKHFADCDRCRRILSNIILLGGEEEEVPAFAAAEVKQIAPSAPWYRKFLAFPNLAYSLGALVLIFGGLIGFTVFQSMKIGELSQNEASYEANKPSVTFSNTTNSTANSVSNSTANSASNSAFNTATTANTTVNSNSVSVSSEKLSETAANNSAVSNPTVQKPNPVPNVAPQNSPVILSETESVANNEEKPVGENRDEANVVTRSLPSKPSKKEVVKDKSVDTKNQRNKAVVSEDKEDAKLSSQSSGAVSTNNLTVKGKTFNRRDNVWYDSAYSNQPTTNITRGTKEYKKLDKDLRQTVERLGGVVVIVWKSKAYRIE